MKFLWSLLLGVVLIGCDRKAADSPSSIVSLHEELGGEALGYERACAPRPFVFPQDHAAHPAFRNEWWYVTGNVDTSDATPLGFHVTFFRIATRPDQAKVSDSAWETSQFYMAHFAVTKAGDSHLIADERFARAGAGLAGATVEDTLATVWLDDWQFSQVSGGDMPTWELRLSDEQGHASIVLKLTALKPRVLQGTHGYSQKSDDPCNASYYYAYTRLHTEGEIRTGNESHHVSGTAWLDREWSSSALADNQVGWDWFALQFDDGRELMFYQLREADGAASEHSSAVEIDVQGHKRAIETPELTVSRWWISETGARYPVEGTLTRPETGEVIRYSPLIDNQELQLTVRYWEGAIRLHNQAGEEIGRGYLELTGY